MNKNIDKWLEFNNRNWKLHVPLIVAQRKVRMEIGRGLLCDSENEQALIHWQNWYHKRKVYEKLIKMSWTKSLLGVAVMFIYETRDGDLDIMLGTALFTNFVSKINEEEQSADIWILPNQDDTGYIFHVIINDKYIQIDSYPNDENTQAGAVSGKIDKSLRIEKRTYINKLGRFPLIQIPNFIRVNQQGQASSTMLNAYPDIYPTMWLIEDLQDNLFIKKKTRRFSRARGYIQATSEEADNVKNKKNAWDDYESDFVIQTVQNNYDAKGGGSTVNYTQGQYNSSDYNLDTDHILKLVFRGIGLSWQADEQGTYTNQNQTLIMQAEDIESQAVWQEFLLDYLYRLFDCWWIFHKYWKVDNNNWFKSERPYSLKFKQAGIIDQMRLVDTNNTRLENATMSRAKYIHIVDSIPMTFAIKEVERIDKEQLETNAKFDIDNENDKDNENNNTGGIKDEFKQK